MAEPQLQGSLSRLVFPGVALVDSGLVLPAIPHRGREKGLEFVLSLFGREGQGLDRMAVEHDVVQHGAASRDPRQV